MALMEYERDGIGIDDRVPYVLDLMNENDVELIINTPSPGPAPKVDEIRMRAEAVLRGIPIITTISGATASIDGLKALSEMGRMEIMTIQEYNRDSKKFNI